MSNFDALKPQLNRIQTNSLIIGIIALVLCAAGGLTDTEQFFHSYLYAYLFWLGVTLGCLAILTLHHIVGGAWGFVIQRLLESGAMMIILMGLFTLPLIFGMKEIFIWANLEIVVGDKVLEHKSAYLNVPFFWIRMAIYFAIWILFAYLLNRWSSNLDPNRSTLMVNRLKRISGPGLGVYVLTVTFMSIDWGMSLDPHWFSTIYGVIFVIGQVLSALALVVIILGWLSKREPISKIIKNQHFHDLGNLMLAFVMLWAYISVSQFLIIWSGNLPEEIPWYIHRLHGGWGSIALILVIFHFAIPFVLLLSRRTKRKSSLLVKVAVMIIFVRLIDLFWLIAPSFYGGEFTLHWLDFITPVGIGGIWMAVFIWHLKGKPSLLPENDPRFQEALNKGAHLG